MVWFKVGCCERCWGVGSRGERGSLGPKLPHGTGQHPQHHPQDADDAGEWKDHTTGGGGGGLRGPGTGTYIYIYIYICFFVSSGSRQLLFKQAASPPLVKQEHRNGNLSNWQRMRPGKM